MPSGSPTILTPDEHDRFYREDQHHPRIRLHNAAVNAINQLLLDLRPSPDFRPSKSSVPTRLRVLCHHYNRNYLILPTDLKLIPIDHWRIVHNAAFPSSSSLTSPIIFLNALYFQERIPTTKEVAASKMVRRKPVDRHQIGLDYPTIKTNTTIIHPVNEIIFYFAKDLHCRAHGSLSADDVQARGSVLDVLNIPNHVIHPYNGGRNLQEQNSISVVYRMHPHIQELDRTLTGGTQRLHTELTMHMLTEKGRDKSRAVENGAPGETAISLRFRIGYGRVQKNDTE